MKALLFLLFILIGYSDLPAQESTLVTIKTGERITDILTSAEIYYYPQFTNGKVFLKDGTKGGGKMNYNRLYGQMIFIDPKGDTLALADEKNIKFIVIDRDTFHYDEGYLRLIANYVVVKLAEKQIWVVADVRKIGTHGSAKNSVAITSLSSYSDDATGSAKSYNFPMNEDIIIRKETQYYFGDENNHFVRSGKKKLMLLFPKDQLSLENYLKENKVDFDKKDDLEKLARYLGQLH